MPYWVYGAQQDNSTVAVPSQGNAATYGVGGGESGHIAVDPRDYNIIYAGNYGGSISRTDRKFGDERERQGLRGHGDGPAAADMKYRFQWNSPIRISPNNPDVVYTASQFVHRTRNGGLDWEVISPDLTRNDKRRQNYSGGEGITRDSTGVEVYGTDLRVRRNRRSVPGLLWAGSDDGLVHVIARQREDTGRTSRRQDWPEGCINLIDLVRARSRPRARRDVSLSAGRPDARTSTRRATTAQTWKRIADGKNGIPANHFVRAVREDPVRKGLLYAGTEFGLYVSFDDGAHWQPFQLNLPRTPVTDMLIYRDDLILTTQGRGFYILDNLVDSARSPRRLRRRPRRCSSSPRTRIAPAGSRRRSTTGSGRADGAGDDRSDERAGRVMYTTTAQPGGRARSGRAGRAAGRWRKRWRRRRRRWRGGGGGAAPSTPAQRAVQGLEHGDLDEPAVARRPSRFRRASSCGAAAAAARRCRRARTPSR